MTKNDAKIIFEKKSGIALKINNKSSSIGITLTIQGPNSSKKPVKAVAEYLPVQLFHHSICAPKKPLFLKTEAEQKSSTQ